MLTKKNTEFIKIGGSKTVTVLLTFDVDENLDTSIIMRNASEAAKWYANTGTLSTWVRKVEIR